MKKLLAIGFAVFAFVAPAHAGLSDFFSMATDAKASEARDALCSSSAAHIRRLFGEGEDAYPMRTNRLQPGKRCWYPKFERDRVMTQIAANKSKRAHEHVAKHKELAKTAVAKTSSPPTPDIYTAIHSVAAEAPASVKAPAPEKDTARTTRDQGRAMADMLLPAETIPPLRSRGKDFLDKNFPLTMSPLTMEWISE